jgi:hypothetical protein
MFNLDRLEQVCIEDLYSRNQTRDFILKDIESGLEKPIDKAIFELYDYFDSNYYESKNTRLNEYLECFNLEELIDEVLIIILPSEQSIKIQTVVGKLANYLDYENQWDGIKTAAEIVAVLGKYEDSLFDIIPAKHSNSGSIEIISNYKLEESTKQRLSNLQYLPPLVCKPKEITSNYQSGYLTKEESIILGSGNHHDKPLALDAINIANSVELSLDEWVMTQEEVSKKPLDTTEKKDNFLRMKNSSQRVYKELVDQGNKFHLLWRFDKRGRMYSSGYHVNIQGTEYKKALINLATPQVIGLV